jgi:hypothetical protein
MMKRSGAIGACAAIVSTAAILSYFAWTGTRQNETLGPIRGVRLGLSPSQVRRQLQTGAPGSFRTTTVGEDFALSFTPHRNGELHRARLEFHLGQLVAARLLLSPDAPESQGPPLAQSAASVLRRERTPNGVELTWIAKSCPTHAAEVRRLLAERR